MEFQTHCQRPVCPGGNCIGCKDGKLYCGDPRCHPYCPECTAPPNAELYGGIIIGIILFVFLIIGIALLLYGTNGQQIIRCPI